MRIERETHMQGVDLAALIGIVVGMSMLVPVYAFAEFSFLAGPAFVVLVPSLLYGLR